MSNNKNVFWQALVIALIVFWMGILIGIYFEKSRVEKLQDFYFNIETDIFDFQLASEIIYGFGLSCDSINNESIYFADKVYWEARQLEKYDNSNKITEELISLHRRYDLLRTLLWENVIMAKEKCGGKINTIVYLYQYNNPSLTTKATQGTMSSLLLDLKGEYGDKIVLIPIAVDTNVESLNALRDFYDLEKTPIIFVNEAQKFETIDSLKEIRQFLDIN
ncbi:MAG: hypothetical protein KKF48_00845 [Nanoarchaeota archaeon]|nr:hypothetical protein [Nanoarchaeota archaeon]MBU1027570.1 hypothetical protein [Nanoarchaeota archaeon]